MGDQILYTKGLGGIADAPIPDLSLARAVLLHGRHATTGAITVENAHPFDLGDGWFGAHNGIIYDHPQLAKYAVDSLSALHSLAKGEDLSNAKGYGTFVLLRGGRILIFRGPGGAIETDTVKLSKTPLNVFCSVLPWTVKGQLSVGECIRLSGEYHGKDKRKIALVAQEYSSSRSFGNYKETPCKKCKNPTWAQDSICWRCSPSSFQGQANTSKWRICKEQSCSYSTDDDSGYCLKHRKTIILREELTGRVCRGAGCFTREDLNKEGFCLSCTADMERAATKSMLSDMGPVQDDGTYMLCGAKCCATCGGLVEDCGADCPRQSDTPPDKNVATDKGGN
ncbi:MAG TPA: hypothetical protein VIY48_09350 [Candidatus Paceibacterota bacterium]